MSVQILIGDCREVLRTLGDGSVHCVVTSPPYWGLRDYGVARQIGLERSPFDYIDELVSVFRAAHRVLRADGTLWLNIGDSYAGSGRGGNPTEETSGLQGRQASQRASMVKRTLGAHEIGATARDAAVTNVGRRATRGSQLPAGFHEVARLDGAIGRAWVPPAAGFKQKDLMGMPWRVALALQADGWWLRQDIIWSKPNPMPESVTDRCTKAHEYLFLLAKSERYYFDQESILEPAADATIERLSQSTLDQQHGSDRVPGKTNGNMKAVGRASGNKTHKYVAAYDTAESEEHRTKAGLLKIADKPYPMRNRRSVWEVTTQPFSEAHFATFPPALIEPCILAGCPSGGTVLDPFGGAGTTGLVADRLGRNAILIELNPEYAAMAERRIRNDAPLFTQVERASLEAAE